MVEKMSLVTLVGDIKQAEYLLKSLIQTEQVNPVSADVGLRVIREYYDEKWGIPTAFLATDPAKMPLGEPLEGAQSKLDHLREQLDIEVQIDSSHLDKSLLRADLLAQIDQLETAYQDIDQKVKTLRAERARLAQFAALDKLEKVQFNLAKLKELNHFEVRLGTMDYEYEKRMTLNYDNVNALVLKVGAIDKQPIYMFISPIINKVKTDNLLRSMHFEPLEILWDYMDYPDKMASRLAADIADIDARLNALDNDRKTFKSDYHDAIIKADNQLRLEQSLDQLKPQVFADERYFITAFWVPDKQVDEVKQALPLDQSTHFVTHSDDVVKGVVVPTKLLNKRLFKPFETLVNLYGTPNYHEADPTGFFALAYMFLFGAMFGDIGQGFVFWLAGFFIAKKSGLQSVGGVLKRIGFSSMLFGFIYDSIFGIEDLISHFLVNTLGLNMLEGIFLKPIENTNLILMLSIAVGMVLLLISFGFSIYNKLRAGDIKEGVFGRNGINGLALFIGLIAVAAMVYNGAPNWVVRLMILVVGLSVLLLIIREPLSNVIAKKLPLYHEGAGAYYMESGFELLETFLGMFSNGVSFIRVGAFALNHVGLFIAFHTIAGMIGSHIGDIAMFIIGNVVVLALEGLIVFIQGLRLVYYELFSKFYSGDGQPFVGITIDKQDVAKTR